MSEQIKIAIDAMGGENSPDKIIDGIKISLKKSKENYFYLFGKENKLNKYLENNSTLKKYCEIVDSKDVILEKGFFISKIFMGGSFNEIVALGKKLFKEVKVFKPKSSRKDSKESFIICKNLR